MAGTTTREKADAKRRAPETENGAKRDANGGFTRHVLNITRRSKRGWLSVLGVGMMVVGAILFLANREYPGGTRDASVLPARGGRSDISDASIRAAVDYMTR